MHTHQPVCRLKWLVHSTCSSFNFLELASLHTRWFCALFLWCRPNTCASRAQTTTPCSVSMCFPSMRKRDGSFLQCMSSARRCVYFFYPSLALLRQDDRAAIGWHHVSIIPLSVFMPIKLSVCSRSKSRNLQTNDKDHISHFMLPSLVELTFEACAVRTGTVAVPGHQLN